MRELPLGEQVEAYAEGGLEPHLGQRTPWMRLDYDLWDTRVEEMGDDLFEQLEGETPKEAVSTALHLERIVNPE